MCLICLEGGTKREYIPVPMSLEESKYRWKVVKERISSVSQGNTHMMHWKVGYLDNYIAQVYTDLANVPYTTGYSPKRWQYGVGVKLQKLEGNCRVDNLCKILLYEADFNHNYKFLGKLMMIRAEARGVIAKEQYRSRKQMTAIQCALNKRLVFDILRQTKKPAVICSCHLKSCYDRIVHYFVYLSMQ